MIYSYYVYGDNGDKMWAGYWELHREDGPAAEIGNSKVYFLFGKSYIESEYYHELIEIDTARATNPMAYQSLF